MRTYFEGPELHITDEWVQAGADRYPLGEIRRAWSGRPARGGTRRTARWALVITGALLLVAVTFWPLVGEWVVGHWGLLAVGLPVIGVLLLWQVGLDVLAHRAENRPFLLWIATDDHETSVLTDNEVEVNKALRALARARESTATY